MHMIDKKPFQHMSKKNTSTITFRIDESFDEHLRKIAKEGLSGFYEGDVAKKIVASQNKYKGLMTLKDLKNYKVKKREPVVGTYRGYKILSMPPPSSGGTHIVQILNILECNDNYIETQQATIIIIIKKSILLIV